MGQLKGLKFARRPPRLDTFTDIQAPSVKKERVNGKDKYTLTPAKSGIITVFSDSENGDDRSSGSRVVKRERSQIPSRVVGHGHRSSQPRIKREMSPDRHGRQQSYKQSSPVAVASDTRQPQVREPLRQRGAHSSSNPPSDSSSSSDSSGPDSSDSSESEDESDSSSDTSSSDGSSSGDEASASVYRPSTPASSIWSSPAQTRRQKDADVRTASANPGTASPSRRSAQTRVSVGSGHAPVNFFIDIPSSRRPEQGGGSRSQTSSAVVPTGAQTDRTAQSNHHRPNNSSPVVLGFMPINRGSPPPKNAPTEPRAMRTGDTRPADMPSRATQRPSVPISGQVSGSSSLPLRGLPLAKDNSQHKDQQRRGPARPGRIMQTVEQPPAGIPGIGSQPKNFLSSSHLRAATPGPSSRRTAPPQPSPGMFVTPRAVSVRPCSVPGNQDSPQSLSQSRGKRTFDETECTESTSKAVELERMLERLRSHEKEMEQQRAQLEDTKRLLAEQKTRIDDLEQQQRVKEVVRDPFMRVQTEERDVSPPPTAVPRDGATLEAAPRGVSPHQVAVPRDVATPAVTVPQHLAPRRDQPEERNRNRRRKASRMARIRLREQERQQIEQERQEALELEQQLEQEQRRAAERAQSAVTRPQNNAQQAPPQLNPRAQAAAQKRIQDEVFSRPLSGHNPEMIFDDDDRPHISEATAFLMRLPQTFVLSKLRKLVGGKPFFDVEHPGSVHIGCWVVSSKRASCDMRMKLTDSGETHGFSFARLAVRLWHDAASIYSLVEHHKNRQKAVHICHNEQCMHPEHIVVEPSSAAAERRRCKREGWCPGHRFVHKDGTVQARKPCIFAPQGAFIRR